MLRRRIYNVVLVVNLFDEPVAIQIESQQITHPTS